jgi:hypothetical protein
MDRALLWFGVVVCTTTIGLSIAAVWLRATSGAPPLPNRFGMSDGPVVGFGILQVVCAIVAMVIVTRLPRNLVAWLMFLIGLSYAIAIVTAAWVFTTATAAGAVTAPYVAWLSQAGAQVAGCLTFLFIFVYPELRPRSPQIALLWLAAFGSTFLGVVMILLHPGPLFFMPQVDNPLGIGPSVALDAAGSIVLPPWTFGIAGVAIVGWVAWRYHTSRGIERLQLKWFLAAALASTIVLLAVVGIGGTGRVAGAGSLLLVYALSVTLVPIAVGIAILRYDLYAIDRIINRVLVYSVVTALLAGVFAVVTVVIGGTLASVTPENQTVTVALSTLIAASLFRPIRQRIQRAVDRRFYRARYDATTTMDRFGERLRRTVDLDELSSEVRSVVADTLHPTTVGVWIDRPTTDARARQRHAAEA